METYSALLAISGGNSPVPGEFPAQRPVMRSFDVSFDLRLNKRLSEQLWDWWFEMLSCPLWRHCNEHFMMSEIKPNSTAWSMFLSGYHQREHQSSILLALCEGIQHLPVDSPVKQEAFLCFDVTMNISVPLEYIKSNMHTVSFCLFHFGYVINDISFAVSLNKLLKRVKVMVILNAMTFKWLHANWCSYFMGNIVVCNPFNSSVKRR